MKDAIKKPVFAYMVYKGLDPYLILEKGLDGDIDFFIGSELTKSRCINMIAYQASYFSSFALYKLLCKN